MPRETILAALCAFLRFAFCCYRAANQTVIIDEATTYNQFVSGPWRKLFGSFDANNHLFSSILIKISVTLSHVSPVTLRLPSLLAGFALTLGAFFLLRRIESRLFRWAAFTLICLHPLLLDFSIAARGYSLSLAFFVWGLYFAGERRYLPATVALTLSIASNLSIVFPVLALLVVFSASDRKALLYLAVPTLLLAGLIYYPSLRHARRVDFYAGYSSLKEAVTSFTFTSLHAGRHGILGEQDVSDEIAIYGLPPFAILLAAATWRTRVRIPFFILAITLIGLVLANNFFGVNYPADRTCLYFVILGALAWAAAGDGLSNRFIQALWLLPAIVVTIQFCTQLQTKYFQFWQEQSDDQHIAQLIEEASAGKPENSLAISCTWIHQPTLEFYRRSLRIVSLKPVQRLEPTPLTGFDFYVLGGSDYERAKGTGLPVLFSNETLPIVLMTSDR